MKVIRILMCLLILLNTACSTINTEKDKSVIAEITRYGIYQRGDELERYLAPETAAGFRTIDEIKFLKETSTIEPSRNLGIGFNYKVTSFNDEDFLLLEVVGFHPQITNNKDETFSTQSYKKTVKLINREYENILIFWFVEDYEMVKGDWRFEIKHKDNVLISKSFTVR